MADEKRIATRVSYGETLVELGAEHDDFLVFDADLAAATQTAKFKAAFPDRFYNAGIAEGNMMGLAAGVATTGRVAFASTFAMFAAGRAYEQIRNSIGYPHLNVKIGATHAGISVGEDGATHQCNEDIALMRTIPGMTVVVPADDVEARAATRCAYATDGPFYLRLGRLAAPVINDPENYEFELGRAIVMREGTDATVVACGLMVSAALEAADALAAEGISVEVVNMHTVKPSSTRTPCLPPRPRPATWSRSRSIPSSADWARLAPPSCARRAPFPCVAWACRMCTASPVPHSSCWTSTA